jgi:hypothetical protein
MRRQQIGIEIKKCETWTLRDIGGLSDRTLETFGPWALRARCPVRGELNMMLKISST